MNNEQIEMLILLGNSVVDSAFTFGVIFVMVRAAVSLATLLSVKR